MYKLPNELISMIFEYLELDYNTCMVNRNIYQHCNKLAEVYIKRYNPKIYDYLIGNTPIVKFKHLTSILKFTKYSEDYKTGLALARLMIDKVPMWYTIVPKFYEFIGALDEYDYDDKISNQLKLVNLDKFFYKIGLTVNSNNIDRIIEIYNFTPYNWAKHMILLGLVSSREYDDIIYWYSAITNEDEITLTADLLADLMLIDNEAARSLINDFKLLYPDLYNQANKIFSESSYNEAKVLSFKLRNKRFTNLKLFSDELWLADEVVRYIDLLNYDMFRYVKDKIPYDIWLLKVVDSGNISIIADAFEELDYLFIDYFKLLLRVFGHSDFLMAWLNEPIY